MIAVRTEIAMKNIAPTARALHVNVMRFLSGPGSWTDSVATIKREVADE